VVNVIDPTGDTTSQWIFRTLPARSAWSLFNSFTEALKGTALAELPARTEALHALFDAETGTPAFEEIEAPRLIPDRMLVQHPPITGLN
jgi:hypothetical protein